MTAGSWVVLGIPARLFRPGQLLHRQPWYIFSAKLCEQRDETRAESVTNYQKRDMLDSSVILQAR